MINFENIDANDSFTKRILEIIDSSSDCAARVLDNEGVDDETVVTVIQRLNIIDSRLILLLSCLHIEELESSFSEINGNEEISFMDLAEQFIHEVNTALDDEGFR